MEEIWRDIVDYEGLYQVSNLGRIKSLSKLCGHSSRQEKILKFGEHKDGYLTIMLSKDGKVKRFLVHRLVATMFLENPENKPCVNHIDCDTSNNCVDNLEWVTHSENMQYASKLGRMKGIENGKKNSKSLIAINLTTGEEIYFNSQHEAARQLNLYVQNINHVLKGKKKRTGNYTFRYAE